MIFFDVTDDQVYKLTRRGTFGESYFLSAGKVHQRNCSPLDYLNRLRFWNQLFSAAPCDLGLSEAGQIVSVQEFITGSKPPQERVDEFLQAFGLTPVKRSCWLWKIVRGDLEIWVGDARDDNFVATTYGIVPIDLRVWLGRAGGDGL